MNQCDRMRMWKKVYIIRRQENPPVVWGETKQWMFSGDVQSDDVIRKIRMKHRETVGLD